MQKRYFEYLSDDSTFAINNRLTGIIGAGVYRGFDVQDKGTADLTLRLKHTGNGASFVNENNIAENNLGIIRTNQGVVIRESEMITLSIESNEISGDPRIDTIVVSHQYKEVDGGEPALYSAIQGTPASDPSAPSVMDDNQVKIGELYIPGGCSDLSDPGVEWSRALTPAFAEKQIEFTEAIYDSAENKIFSNKKDRDYYYLNFDSPDNQYKSVDQIDLASRAGANFFIVSNQPLQIQSTSNIKTTDDKPVIVRPFEEVRLVYYGSQFGVAPNIVVMGGEVQRNLVNKLYKTLKLNVASDASFAATEPYALDLTSDGNYVSVTLSDTDELRYIQSLYDGGNLSGDNNGALLFLNISVASGLAKITNKGGTVPSGYKDIKFPWGPNANYFWLGSPATLVLYETDTEWLCVGMTGENYNTKDLYDKVSQFDFDTGFNDNEIFLFDAALDKFSHINLYEAIQNTGLSMANKVVYSYGELTDSFNNNVLRHDKEKQIIHHSLSGTKVIRYIWDLNDVSLPEGFLFSFTISKTDANPLTIDFDTGNIKNAFANSYSGSFPSEYEVGDGETFLAWSDGTYVWLIATGLLNNKVAKLEDDVSQNETDISALQALTVREDWKEIGNDGGASSWSLGWSAYSTSQVRPLSYRKNGDYLELHGGAQTTGTGSVAELPASYAPAKRGYFTAYNNFNDGAEQYELVYGYMDVGGGIVLLQGSYQGEYFFNARIPLT